MLISDKSSLSSANIHSTKENTCANNQKDPKDSILIKPPRLEGDNVIISYPEEHLKKVKKEMEKAGFEFNDEGRAPSIVTSNGIDPLRPAEEAVTLYGGKVTGTLWLIDAFTAELTPAAYCFLHDKAHYYRASPDSMHKKLINLPPNYLCPKTTLLNLEKLLGF